VTLVVALVVKAMLLFSIWLLCLLQGVRLPEDVSWKEVEQWLREGGADGEVLLVFENTEDVLLLEKPAQVCVFHALLCSSVLYCAALRCAALHCELWCRAVPCRAVPCRAVPLPCPAAPCRALPCRACRPMPAHVMSCHIMHCSGMCFERHTTTAGDKACGVPGVSPRHLTTIAVQHGALSQPCCGSCAVCCCGSSNHQVFTVSSWSTLCLWPTNLVYRERLRHVDPLTQV
jgi:hypothetical protein